MSPVNALLLNCSLVNNSVSASPSTMYAFTPNVEFGGNISPSISEFSWIDLQAGNYSTFDIWLTDQNFNQIQARDPNAIFQLLIKSKGE
jgi:hypothetical protein